MPRSKPAAKPAARSVQKPVSKAQRGKPAVPSKAAKPSKPSRPAALGAAPERLSAKDVLRELEKAGSAQTRKTYARHGVTGPMYGVSFAVLRTLVKRIGVDHELALQLWDTGNFDARNLAFKIVDPARMSPADVDRWASEPTVRMCGAYVTMIAAESGHGFETASRWLASTDERLRCAGWGLVSQLAARSPDTPDAWLAERLAQVAATIHEAPNAQREVMNGALIAIGGRSAALRKAALAAAKRIGKVEVDHGDTACKTPEAAPYIEKMWAHAEAKGFASPSAQEQKRESPRTRC